MTILTPDFGMAGAVLPKALGGAAVGPVLAPAGTASDDSLADDARLYLRHVEGGESIRAIAREAGCHASTILRRIRRFECRRDDPLVDGALQNMGVDALPPRSDRANQDQTRRVLRRLAEPGAEMVVASGMEKAIITRGEIRTAILDRKLAEEFALNKWVEQLSQGSRMIRYRLSPAGRAALRRLGAGEGGLPRASDFADAEPVRTDGPKMPRPSAMPTSTGFGARETCLIWKTASRAGCASIWPKARCNCWRAAATMRASRFWMRISCPLVSVCVRISKPPRWARASPRTGTGS